MEQLINVPPQPKTPKIRNPKRDLQGVAADLETLKTDVLQIYTYLYKTAQLLGPGLERIQRKIEELGEEEN